MLSPASRLVRRSHRGFTLLELMITLAVIGILAGVAYPTYLSQVRKGRRSEAVQALAGLQQAQERWRSSCTSYASDPTTAWPSTACASTGGLGQASPTKPSGYYTLAITAADASTYTATATAVSGTSQASDTGCTVLTVAVSNGTATNTPVACWSK